MMKTSELAANLAVLVQHYYLQLDVFFKGIGVKTLPCGSFFFSNLLMSVYAAASLEFTWSQTVSSIPGTLFCAWDALEKHWLANNILGIAFCIQGIEMLSLGSFTTSVILLGGLFFYYLLMVGVAKSFDAPIKLLFPTSDPAKPFSMLGLGDICDSRGSYFGYTVGLVLTITVRNWFQAAQPALRYIVPGVIGFLAAHCTWRGEVKLLSENDESKPTTDRSSNASPEEKNEDAKQQREGGIVALRPTNLPKLHLKNDLQSHQ